MGSSIEKERLNDLRSLRVLNSCFRAMLNNFSEKALLQDICRIIVDEGGYCSSWIGVISDKSKDVRLAAYAGIKLDESDDLKVSYGRNKYGRGPCGKAIRSGRVQICEDIPNAPEFDPWRGLVKRNLFKSSASFPLLRDGFCLGALNVFSHSKKAFPKPELTLLQEVTENLAYGINAIRSKIVVSRTERQLRQSEKQYRILTEAAQVGIWQLSPDGIVEFANRKMLEMLEMDSPDDLLGKSSKTYIPEEAVGIIKYDRIKDFGSYFSSCDAELLGCKGGLRNVIVSGLGLFSETGRFLGYIETFTDITEKRKSEEAAALHKQQLIQADKMASLGLLVAGVAHEINNPTNLMMLNSPILKNAWKDAIPALEEYSSSHEDFYMAGFKLQEMKQVVPSLLEGISEGVNRIRDIVNGLKDYARQDKIVCLDENVNINQVVEKAVSLLSSMIKSSALNFKLDLDPDIKELKGNFQRFEQIVINLVQNACQVLEDSGSGFLLIRTEMENGWVALIVEDDGKGIPNEDMPYVSDPFFSSKRDSGGTGLGLAIVKVIVNEFGGQMEIKSQEGSGTKVKVVLPVAEDK